MTTAHTAFEVLDALGLAELVKRTGDLGGSVPLRAARGCAPLIEGNAFGFQITLRQPIILRRGRDRVAVEIAEPYGEALAAAHRAVVPRLITQGVLRADEPLSTAFSDSFVKVDGADTPNAQIHLWTGLCVRADAGVWLRVSASANRRNRHIDVDTDFIADGVFVPLILKIRLSSDAPDRICLAGEIGTVAPVAPGVRIDEVPLAAAPEIGLAHAAFYDAAYHEAKKLKPTLKYRKMDLPPESVSDAVPRCRLVPVGPAAHAVCGAIGQIVVANLVPFEAQFDGYAVTVTPDQGMLRSGAREVERTFAEALGPAFLGENRHAIWYFTKYFTPHPAGEPHFFIKPWILVQTPPGWSCLLEGVHGDGFDVLRGVVATDVFHAVPAVFQVFRSGETVCIPAGAPLLKVIPIPRRLLQAGFRETTFRG